MERRELCGAAFGFLALSFVFCYPAGLSTQLLHLGAGDAGGAYFPYILRTFQPDSSAVAGPWDPTASTGLPESHSPAGRYYPPTIGLFTLLPPVLAYGLATVLHHAWAGLGAYLLARGSGLSRSASWLAGIVFGFGGFLVFHRGHVPVQHAAAWLPWVLWSLERFRKSGEPVWITVTGTLLALHGLAGNQQMVVMGAIVWLIYLFYYTAIGPGGAMRRARFTVGVLAACALGALGSLPQLLPMLEVAHWSPYREFRPDFFGSGYLKAPYLAGLLGPWVLGDRFGVTHPDGYLGLGEHGLFYGVLPLTAALAGIVWWVRVRRGSLPVPAASGREVGFWLILLGCHLLLVLGKTTPLFALLAHVPVYNIFHIPARHVWVIGLCVAWLAALGLDRLQQDLAAPRLLRGTAATLLVLAALCLLAALTVPRWPDRPGWRYPGWWIPLASTLAALAILTAVRGWRRLAILVPILTFLELWLSIGDFALSVRPADVLTRPESFPAIVHWLREREPDGLPPRCLIRDDSWQVGGHPWKVPESLGSAWGLSSLNCYSQSLPRSLALLLRLDSWGHPDLPAVLAEQRGLSAVGGRYIVAGGPLAPFAPGLGHQVSDGSTLVWSPDACSPGHLSPLALGSPDGRAASLWLDLDRTYLLEGEVIGGRPCAGVLRVVQTARSTAVALAETRFGPDDFHDGRLHLACVFDTGPTGGGFWITVEGLDAPPQLALWQLARGFAGTARLTDASEVARVLREGVRNPYPIEARFEPDLQVYENPDARGLATLVGELRPAESDLDAVLRIIAPGPPVREMAYVAAPGGRSHDLEIHEPLAFAPGIVTLDSYRPDDITLTARTPGEGFLVLAVTRCAGWSARVDGVEVPIHAVDGPLMGVRVPPGEHVIRFRYRPILAWAGLAAALIALGGAWSAVLVAQQLFSFRRGRTWLCFPS